MLTRRILSIIKWAFILVSSFLLLYGLVGTFILPMILKSKLPDIIQQQTGRKALISNVQFQPFKLTLSMQGVQIQEPNGQPFIAFDNFYIKIGLAQSIKQAALIVDEVILKKPLVHIARQKNGTFNFQGLLKPTAENKTSVDHQIFPVIFTKIVLSEGKLDWEDASSNVPVREELNPINITIQNLTTYTDKQAIVGLSLTLKSGGELAWQGNLKLNPLSSEGHISFIKAKLMTLASLASLESMPFELDGSELLDADYKLSYIENDLELQISKASVEVHDLQLLEKKQKKALLKIPVVASKGIQFDLKKQIVGIDSFLVNELQFSEKNEKEALVKIPVVKSTGILLDLKKQIIGIDSVTANNGKLEAWLNSDGNINYQAMFSDSNTVANSNAVTVKNNQDVKNTPWAVTIKSIAVNNFGLDFQDKTVKKPVAVSFNPINFKLNDYSNSSGAKLPVDLLVGINNKGSMKLSGDTVIEPFSTRLNIKIENIDLENYQPYYDKWVRLDVIDGALNIDGDLSVAKLEQDKPDVQFKGNIGIDNLLTRDQKRNKDFVKWDKLTLTDLAIDRLTNNYTATTLLINKPYARVTIRKDKTVNFNDIVIGDKTESAKSIQEKHDTKKQADKDKPFFKLNNVQIVDGASDFSDLSLILPFAAQIKSLDGGLTGISSDKKSKIKVSMQGNAYDLAPVDIKGEISPMQGIYHIDINFKGMPMPLVSPYMVQFAGYKVEKGKMTLGLQYNIVNRELIASNNLLIDQFELGDKVENPNAVSLPLKLAVALLKDANGKIKIDVPITGSLDDPKFSLSAIVTDALFNVLSKVVTAPFRALGSLFGSEKEMSTVSFSAGSSALNKQQQKKLNSLADELNKRPALNLDIKGAAFQEQDWPVIRGDALYDQLKKRRAIELNKGADKKIREEYVELSDEDYKRLLADLFIEKFPLLAEKSFLGTPKLMNPSAGDFYEIAKQKLFTVIKVQPQRLKVLAVARAQAIANYMVQKGGIPAEKIFILDTVLDPARDNKEITSYLSLNAI